MNQADLFDWPQINQGTSIVPRARRNNVHTSVQAALGAIGLAGAHCVVILACLKRYGPATGHELAERSGLQYQQISKRTAELHEQGKIDREQIAFDGKPIYLTRLSPSGRSACVWHLCHE